MAERASAPACVKRVRAFLSREAEVNWVMALAGRTGQRRVMTDTLFSRSRIAIEESCLLREQKRALADVRDGQLAKLRLSVLDSAMSRSEIKAHRDNKGEEDCFNSEAPRSSEDATDSQ